MAAIESLMNNKRRKGIQVKRSTIRIDMTPMVDLGFLLITFFVFTASLNEPKSLNLNMPADGPPTLLANSASLTVLLDAGNKIYYYEGQLLQDRSNIHLTDYSITNGIGGIIQKKKALLNQHQVNGEKQEGLMVIIKAAPGASYKNLVDMLDEALIHEVKKYAVIKMSGEEMEWLQQQ